MIKSHHLDQGVPSVQELIINHFPPNLNEYRNLHYRVSNKLKKDWALIVQNAVHKQKIERVNKVIMTYTFHFKDNYRRDPDNFAACAKFIQDALITSGVLIDDDFNHVVELRVRRGANAAPPYILITLEEIG